jgi:hypothetical protein
VFPEVGRRTRQLDPDPYVSENDGKEGYRKWEYRKKRKTTGKKGYRNLEHVFGKIPGKERKLHQQHVPERQMYD